MLIIFFLLTVTLFSLYFVLKLFEPKFRVKKRLDIFVNLDKTEMADEENQRTEKETRVKNPMTNFRSTLNDYIGKNISSKKEQNLEKKLLQSGNPMGMNAVDFQVLKLVLNIMMPAIFAVYGKLLKLGFGGAAIFAVLGLALSVLVPEYYIKQKIKQRYKQALKELPDFLDLLTVCLEAGLGFDGALNKVIGKRTGVLSAEFHICIEEIRLGKTRREGLTGIRDRLEFDEMKSLINSILQAEKLGISIVQVLRIKSEEEREKRRQRAEEEAMKAPIKILFPLVLFIFPSIFTVLLGPAIIQLISTFGK